MEIDINNDLNNLDEDNKEINTIREVKIIKIKELILKTKFYQHRDHEGNTIIHSDINHFKDLLKNEKYVFEDVFLDVLNDLYKNVKLNEKHLNINIFLNPSVDEINKVIKVIVESIKKYPFYYIKHVININIFLNFVLMELNLINQDEIQFDIETKYYFKIFYLYPKHFYIYSKLRLKKDTIIILNKEGKMVLRSYSDNYSIIGFYIKTIYESLILKHPYPFQSHIHFQKSSPVNEETTNYTIPDDAFSNKIYKEDYRIIKLFIEEIQEKYQCCVRNSYDDINLEILLFKKIYLDKKFEVVLGKSYYCSKLRDYTSIFLDKIHFQRTIFNFCSEFPNIIKYKYQDSKQDQECIKKVVEIYNKELNEISITNNLFCIKKNLTYNIGYKRKYYKIKNLTVLKNHYSLHSDQEIEEPYINIFTALQEIGNTYDNIQIDFKINPLRSKKIINEDLLIYDIDENEVSLQFEKGYVYLFLFMINKEDTQYHALYDFVHIVNKYKKKYPNLKLNIVHYSVNQDNDDFEEFVEKNFCEVFFIHSEQTLHKLLKFIYPNFIYSNIYHYFIIDEEGFLTDFHLKDFSNISDKIEYYFNKKEEISENEYKNLKLYGNKELVCFDYNILGVRYRPGILLSLQKKYIIDDKNNVVMKKYYARVSTYIRADNYYIINHFKHEFNKIVHRNILKINNIYETYVIDKEKVNLCYFCYHAIALTAKIYFCYFCEKFICESCGLLTDKICENEYEIENIDENRSKIMKLCIFDHNLSIIPNINKVIEYGNNVIERWRFGNNLHIPKLYIKETHHFGFVCSLCNELIKSEEFRYICLNCRGPEIFNSFGARLDGFVDLCKICFDKILNKDNGYTDNEINKIEGHLVNSHVYLRLCFLNGSYFNY
jgi:hypothetical protein